MLGFNRFNATCGQQVLSILCQIRAVEVQRRHCFPCTPFLHNAVVNIPTILLWVYDQGKLKEIDIPSLYYFEETQKAFWLFAFLFVTRKPLARRVVQKKPNGEDVDKKTPFAIE